MSSQHSVSPAEFSQIDLDFVIATPLLTTINAHAVAAQSTLNFIESIKDNNMKFTVKTEDTAADGTTTSATKELDVPLLAITKVPQLNFDSLSVDFNYSISQVAKQTKETAVDAKLSIGAPGLLGKLLNINFKGKVATKKTSENTVNRGGELEVKVNVSEAGTPPGLEKIISAMVNSIDVDNA
ncbi:MAG: DUF2589 domain-containing protein [Bacteroidota bacterium]